MEFLTREQELKAASDRGRPVPVVKKTEPKKDWCIRIPRKWLFEAIRELSPIEKLVLIGLRAYANAEGQCWPSMRRLSYDLNISINSTRKYLKTLEAKKILKISARKGKKWYFELYQI